MGGAPGSDVPLISLSELRGDEPPAEFFAVLLDLSERYLHAGMSGMALG